MAEFRLDIVGNSESMTNALDNVSKGLQEVGQDAIETSKKTQAAFGNNGGVEQFGKSLKDQVLVLARLEAEMKKIIAAKKTAFDGKEAAALDTQLKGVTKTLTALDAEMGKTDDTAKSLKAQLRENKEILSQLEDQGLETTDTFFQLAVQTGKLQDQIGDTNERIKFFASDTKGIDGLIAVTKIAAGGFAVAQGAAAIFGAENENVQKALLKVNAAMAVLNGLQEIQQALQKSSAARITIETALRKAKIFVLGSETVATEGLTTAQIVAANAAKVLRAALLATGIGAVVFLIGTLISAASAMSDFAKDTEDATKAIKDQDEALKDLQSTIDFNTKKQLADAKKLGASNELLRNIEKQGLQENLKALEDDIANKRALLAKANEDRIKAFIGGSNEEKKATLEQYKVANEALNRSLSARTAALREYALFNINSQTEANKELEDNNKKFEDSEEKRREKARQKREKAKADEAENELKAQKIKEDMMKAFNDFNNDNMKNQFDIEKEERDKIIKNNLDFLNSVQEVKELELDIEFETGNKSIAETKRIAEEKIKTEIEFAQKKLEILKSLGGDESQIRAIELAIAKGKNQLDLLAKDGDSSKFLKAIGLGDITETELEDLKSTVNTLVNTVKGIFTDALDASLQSNETLISNLNAQIQSVQQNIEQQQKLQSEGAANNLLAEQQKLDTLESQRRDAFEKEKKLQRERLTLDAATQVSSLITASTGIFASLAEFGPVGIALAVATIGAMFAAFAATQVRARQSINSQTFEKGGKVKGRRHYEGGERYYSEDGNLVEIEAGEYVTRRKQSDKYATLLDAINSDTLHRMDLQQLLRHTGVSLSPTEVEGFKTTVNNNERAAIAYKVKLESEFNPEIKGLRDDFNTFRSETKNKKQITFENGYMIEKIGSRTIRTKI